MKLIYFAFIPICYVLISWVLWDPLWIKHAGGPNMMFFRAVAIPACFMLFLYNIYVVEVK